MPRQIQTTNEGNLDNAINPSNNIPEQNGENIQAPQEKNKQQINQVPNILDSEENRSILQTIKEEIKFEIKQELIDALNSEHMSLVEIDPQTSYALKAAASALNKSVSNIFPIGGNDLFNQQQQQQEQATAQQMAAQQQQQPQQQKKASADELSDLLIHSTITKLASTDYFNQEATEEEFMKDIYSVVEVITNGMNKFAEDNMIDFYDPNNEELLIELINDGTFFDLGSTAE